METVSLMIMIAGLVALAVIYLISRKSRKDLPQTRKLPPLHTLHDENGEEISSIMEDYPARDGKSPNANAPDMSDVMNTERQEKNKTNMSAQLIMFIAADNNEGFEGTRVLEALDNAGLVFGDMNVYHRLVLTDSGEQSLFNVANGVKPWTLIPEEIAVEHTPGLSMILNLPSPSPLKNREAIHDFVRTAERINAQLGGILKNQNQEPITEEQRRAYFAMI
ncbi:MAG: hypothetical protein CR991_01535 [Proteobacteria bacterium]|nr:MAG: hypothetical protein CR991_01535 [Pseudomonadota bacterium]